MSILSNLFDLIQILANNISTHSIDWTTQLLTEHPDLSSTFPILLTQKNFSPLFIFLPFFLTSLALPCLVQFLKFHCLQFFSLSTSSKVVITLLIFSFCLSFYRVLLRSLVSFNIFLLSFFLLVVRAFEQEDLFRNIFNVSSIVTIYINKIGEAIFVVNGVFDIQEEEEVK